MAVIVNGYEHRTLDQPLYTGDGRQIKEVYVGGRKVYPEADVPFGRYALRLRGMYTRTFLTGEPTTFRPGGLLSSDSSDWEESTISWTGTVELTAVSHHPIALIREELSIPSPSGMKASSGYPKDHKETGYVVPANVRLRMNADGWYTAPDGSFVLGPEPIKGSVGFAFTGDSSGSGAHTDDVYGCPWPHHVAVRFTGWNTRNPRGYTSGTLVWSYPIEPMTQVRFMEAQKTYETDYHRISPDVYDTSFVSTTGTRSTAMSWVDSYTKAKVSAVSVNRSFKLGDLNIGSLYAGYKLEARIPFLVSPLWEQTREDNVYYPVSICPFTEVVYNNNPPVTSLSFLRDEPTEEMPDWVKESPFA